MTEKNLSYFQAVRLVLLESPQGLSLQEIEREILRRQLRDSVIPSGMRSVIYKDIYKGNEATFCQNEDGRYTIRETSNSIAKKGDNSHDGNILVFDTNKLNYLGYFQDIRSNFSPYRDGILNEQKPIFMDREKAEQNPLFKQVVSYVIVKHKDHLLRFVRHETKRNSFLEYLDGKYSIGFGGHVQQGDLLFSKKKDSGYTASLERELFEESLININNVKSIKFIGVLNDDSTPRGRCHFAFIHLIELENLSFNDNDKYVNDLKFVSFQEISNEFASYEWWSKLCLQHFFPKKLKFECFIDAKDNFKLIKHFQFIAVVGEIGSGKSQVCSILTERYGYVHVPCSRIMREVIGSEAASEINRQNLQDIGYKFINSFNAHEIFANRIAEYIRESKDGSRFLIDGLRYPETFIKLQEILSEKIPVIYVGTNVNMQYENFREREKNSTSFDEFLKVLGHPVENQIQRFLPYSKIIILNHGALDSLGTEIITFFDKELMNSNLQIAWDLNARFRHEQILRGNDLTFSNIFVPQFVRRVKEIKDHKSSSVLDVGCGTGILTGILAEYVEKVVGIDYSCDSIDIARKYTTKDNVTYECSAIESYHTQTPFDIIISNMTFHTVENIDKALKNIYAMLTKGGKLIFTLPHPRYYPLRDRVKKTFVANGYDYNKESFHRIPFTISREPDPLPSPTPYFHRPLHVYETKLDQIGFLLTEIYVPFPDIKTIKMYPDNWSKPHILIGTAQKQ